MLRKSACACWPSPLALVGSLSANIIAAMVRRMRQPLLPQVPRRKQPLHTLQPARTQLNPHGNRMCCNVRSATPGWRSHILKTKHVFIQGITRCTHVIMAIMCANTLAATGFSSAKMLLK